MGHNREKGIEAEHSPESKNSHRKSHKSSGPTDGMHRSGEKLVKYYARRSCLDVSLGKVASSLNLDKYVMEESYLPDPAEDICSVRRVLETSVAITISRLRWVGLQATS